MFWVIGSIGIVGKSIFVGSKFYIKICLVRQQGVIYGYCYIGIIVVYIVQCISYDQVDGLWYFYIIIVECSLFGGCQVNIFVIWCIVVVNIRRVDCILFQWLQNKVKVLVYCFWYGVVGVGQFVIVGGVIGFIYVDIVSYVRLCDVMQERCIVCVVIVI